MVDILACGPQVLLCDLYCSQVKETLSPSVFRAAWWLFWGFSKFEFGMWSVRAFSGESKAWLPPPVLQGAVPPPVLQGAPEAQPHGDAAAPSKVPAQSGSIQSVSEPNCSIGNL